MAILATIIAMTAQAFAVSPLRVHVGNQSRYSRAHLFWSMLTTERLPRCTSDDAQVVNMPKRDGLPTLLMFFPAEQRASSVA